MQLPKQIEANLSPILSCPWSVSGFLSCCPKTLSQAGWQCGISLICECWCSGLFLCGSAINGDWPSDSWDGHQRHQPGRRRSGKRKRMNAQWQTWEEAELMGTGRHESRACDWTGSDIRLRTKSESFTAHSVPPMCSLKRCLTKRRRSIIMPEMLLILLTAGDANVRLNSGCAALAAATCCS